MLATGYFLAAREAYRVMLEQGFGGSIVFISSKNALAASPQASAYCTAKAAELHLARCLALEGAPHQIRVNSVNPDAVLQGSKICKGEWRKEGATPPKPDGTRTNAGTRIMCSNMNGPLNTSLWDVSISP